MMPGWWVYSRVFNSVFWLSKNESRNDYYYIMRRECVLDVFMAMASSPFLWHAISGGVHSKYYNNTYIYVVTLCLMHQERNENGYGTCHESTLFAHMSVSVCVARQKVIAVVSHKTSKR